VLPAAAQQLSIGRPAIVGHQLTLGDVGWQAHVEVWVLLAGIVAVGWYVTRVLEPKAVAAGYPPVTRRQRLWFVAAMGSLWLASDWPVHDVAEAYLYSIHMLQHLLISMLIPAMFLLAMPSWLFDLLLPAGGGGRRLLAATSRPLVAGLVFNALTVSLHWSTIVQLSFDSGPFHFVAHLLVFTAGMLMWMPVIGPEQGWRLPPVGQCIYLFMMSVVPTVPGGWLVFAEGVVYRHYDTIDRLWGIDVLSDQQAAGVVMKLVGGFFLWGVIVTIFFRWAGAEMQRDEEARRARQAAQRSPEPSVLTFEQVAERFAQAPAPSEPPA
jgi:putative membrane protein